MDNNQLELMGVAVQPGAVLLGKYRVDRVIGVGGMGAVIGARHLQLDERVAIKFLLPGMLQHEEVVQRFLREARSAIKIRSEHCVRVLDVGTLENGAPYMVMEFLEGQDLSQISEQNKRLPVADVIDWVLQACEALAEAHLIGIVHRDLKPANLFLTTRADGSPSVKVLDFGISKQATSSIDAGVTKTQAVLGSPRYMSPEQMRSTRDVDARADVWALGAVVHELIAGTPAFDAETMTALCAAILQDTPKSMASVRADVSPELDAALAGALEKDRNRRYANVAQLAAALAPFGSARAQASAERIARVLGVQSALPAGLRALPHAASTLAITGGAGAGGAGRLAATTGGATATTSPTPTATATPSRGGAGTPRVAIVAASSLGAVLVLGGVIAFVALRKPHEQAAAAGSPSSVAQSVAATPASAPPPAAVSLTPPAPPASASPEPSSSAVASAAPRGPGSAPASRPASASGGGGGKGASPAGSGGKGAGTPPSTPARPPASNGNNPFGDDRRG